MEEEDKMYAVLDILVVVVRALVDLVVAAWAVVVPLVILLIIFG